jgi:hypothetical protein
MEVPDMKLSNPLTIRSLSVATIALMAILAVGCSGDGDSNSVGPNPAPNVQLDDITVNLSKIAVKYDCDLDPIGITQPGDFSYSLNIDTLAADGTWLRITSNKTQNADINTGSSKTPTGQSAVFRFARREGQTFRVVLKLAENDANGKTDFNETKTIAHSYASNSPQLYAPSSGVYTSWNAGAKLGTMSWNINKRDRTKVLGVLTKEGCNVTATYSVLIRSAS